MESYNRQKVMQRLILGLVVGYLLYWGIKKLARSLGWWPQASGPLPHRPPQSPEPDELVQDPVCGTYIPRKDALRTDKDGQAYYFCSEGCLKRFRRNISQ
jgi:YHS domain-containing protein